MKRIIFIYKMNKILIYFHKYEPKDNLHRHLNHQLFDSHHTDFDFVHGLDLNFPTLLKQTNNIFTSAEEKKAALNHFPTYHMHTSETFVIANGIAPASRINRIASLSSSLRMFRRSHNPPVCNISLTAMQSFVDIGTPKNGFVSLSCSAVYLFDAISSSTLAASCNASSNRSSTTQFNSGFTCLIRAMNDFRTCVEVNCNIKYEKILEISIQPIIKF